MWSDFIIVGPPEDPAKIRTARTAKDAFARIARAGGRFCSRNDLSGTHTKELEVWRASGVNPESLPEYQKMGQPMMALLRSTDELRAYTLTDRATFAQRAANLQLVALFAGDPTLRNTYAVILIRAPDSDHHRNGRRFVEWLVQGRGRSLIASLEIHGQRMFHPM